MFWSLLSKSLIGGVVAQATASIRHEVASAKTELINKIKALAVGFLFLTFGVGIAVFATGFLAYAAMVALSEVWPTWLAALTVAGVLIAIASIFLSVGLKRIRKNSDLRPERLMNAYRRFNLDDS